MSVSFHPVAAIAACLVAAPSLAGIVDTYSVGTGQFHSSVQIDFSTGDGYLFDVAWSGSATGMDLLQIIDDAMDASAFQLVTDDFGWGAFVSGLGVGDSYEYGTGDFWPDVENYWHYWIDDGTGAGWESSWSGASDRMALDGSHDGWVFILPDAPQSVPAPAAGAIALLCGGSEACSRRRRRPPALTP
ncbi:MAG: hypothetical protein O2819_03965 [Planctomycetota bacterium]|nr:hypothetical protein [Planctomycetota bacterium]